MLLEFIIVISSLPLIFVLTQSDDMCPLFSAVLSKCTTIHLRAVNDTNMRKALNRVVSSERIRINSEDFEDIILTSCGDIRSCISKLQFKYANLKIGLRSVSQSKLKKSKSNVTAVSFSETLKDSAMTVFHATGKILHRSKSDINLILATVSCEAETLLLYVHQNYLSFILNYSKDFDFEISDIADTFSKYEVFREKIAHDPSNEFFPDITSLINTTLFSFQIRLYSLVSSFSSESVKSSFSKTYKPLFFGCKRTVDEKKSKTRLFMQDNLKCDTVRSMYSTKNFYSDIIPFLNVICNSKSKRCIKLKSSNVLSNFSFNVNGVSSFKSFSVLDSPTLSLEVDEPCLKLQEENESKLEDLLSADEISAYLEMMEEESPISSSDKINATGLNLNEISFFDDIEEI